MDGFRSHRAGDAGWPLHALLLAAGLTKSGPGRWPGDATAHDERGLHALSGRGRHGPHGGVSMCAPGDAALDRLGGRRRDSLLLPRLEIRWVRPVYRAACRAGTVLPAD